MIHQEILIHQKYINSLKPYVIIFKLNFIIAKFMLVFMPTFIDIGHGISKVIKKIECGNSKGH